MTVQTAVSDRHLHLNPLSNTFLNPKLLRLNMLNVGRSLFQFQNRADSAEPSALVPYEYAPLPGPHFIRVLEIKPGDGTIHCSLHVLNLQNSPLYDALSYTWGDPRPPLLQTIAPAQYQN